MQQEVKIYRSFRKRFKIYYVFGIFFLFIGICAIAITVSHETFNWVVAVIWFLVSASLVMLFGWLSAPPMEMELKNEQLIFRIGRARKEVVFTIFEVTEFSWSNRSQQMGRSQGSVARNTCYLKFTDGSEFDFDASEYENFEQMRSALFTLLDQKNIIDFSRFSNIKARERERVRRKLKSIRK